MRWIFYFSNFLLLSFLGCQLTEIHVNELAPETFERVLEQQAEGAGLTINAAVKTEDGGVAIVGTKVSVCSREGVAIGFLMRLDKNGLIQDIEELALAKPFCEANWVPKDVVAIGNNEFATCGFIIRDEQPHFSVYIGGNNGVFYVKEGFTGQANALIATGDQGLIAVGEIREEGGYKGYMVKLNTNLEVIWEKIWEDETPDNRIDNILSVLDIVAEEANDFTVLLNGAFQAALNISSFQEDTPASLFSVNGSFEFSSNVLDKLMNGSYIHSRGEAHPGGAWSEVVAYSSGGESIWNTPKFPVSIHDLQPTEDGGFLIFGTTIPDILGGTGIAPSNAILIKMDANGQEVWRQTYGGNLIDEGHHLVLLDNGGFMLVGINRSISAEDEVAGSKGIYIIRTDKNGNVN